MSSDIDSQYNGTYGGYDDTIGVVTRIDSSTNIVSGDVYFKYKDHSDEKIYFDQMFSFIIINPHAESSGNAFEISGDMNFFQYTTYRMYR